MAEHRERLWKYRVSFALFVLAYLAIVVPPIAAAPADPGKEGEERYRFKIPGWVFTRVSDGVADTRSADANPDKVLSLIQTNVDAAGDGKAPDQLKHIGAIFKQHSFEVVEKIAKSKKLEVAGTRKGSTISADMGLMRRQMINQAMSEAVRKLDPDGKLTIGMLDSGNKNSGIASDVDQTVFVTPRDVGEGMKPRPVTVEEVIKQFNAEFEAKFGCHPERMGIECMNGNDFYPDWRQQHSSKALSMEARRVVHEKRKNPEAYRSEGELKIQAEGRGYEALQQHHERVAELEKAKTRIEEIRKDRTQVPEADQARINKIEAELLSKFQNKYSARSIAELEQKFSKDSPWTEVRNNPDGEPHISQMEDPKGKVLKVEPELARRFAFDGSWDNWVMYEHHAHNRRKYLLRSIAEGPGLLRKIEEGKPLTTFEYEKVYGGHNSEGELRSFLRQTYQASRGQPRLSEEKVEQFKRCLDVAARERLRHKGQAGFSSMTDKQVWGPYWPELSAKEAKLYSDMPKEALDKLLLERAIRTWEMDAREIMIENLIRTVTEPAKLLEGPDIRSKAVARIQSKHPRAKPKMLQRAVREQLYAGIHDLISVEHARELVADPETKKALPKRNKDLVDRILVAVAGTPYEAEVRQIVVDAATARIRVEPGQQGFLRALGSFYWDSVKTRYANATDGVRGKYNSTVEAYKTARQRLASGELTAAYVGREMLRASGNRLGALKTRAGQTYMPWGANVLGFKPSSFNMLIPVKGPLPKVDLSSRGVEWSAAKFAKNIRSHGNADSVLMVMLAYQERGPEAAAWAAGFEAIMNVPGVAQLNAVKDLAVHQQPQGVVMLGSAMFVPALGQVYIFVNIGKNSVILLGNFVFETLKDDTADLLYQGFLEQEAGWLRPGTKGVVRGQRVSLLHFVPARVIQKPVKTPDGNAVKNDKGDPVMTAIWSRYSRDEARELFNVFPEEYEALAQLGILGGGEQWKTDLAGVKNDIAKPRGSFEAKRASMYYHFRARIEPLLAPKKIDVHEDEAFPIIFKFFLDYLDQWINARGAFAGFDENVLISRRFEVSKNLNNQALRNKIATRATNDFIRSYYLIKGSVIDKTSIERSTEMRIRQARDGDLIEDANMIIQAIHEARWVNPDIDMAQAFHALLEANRDLTRQEAERGTPYARVRPRVVQGRVPSPEDHHRHVPVEKVEFLVSVVADPDKYPAPYRTEVQWLTGSHSVEAKGALPDLSNDQKRQQDQDEVERIARGQNTEILSAIVRVYDANNREIELVGDQTMPIEIGHLKVPRLREGTRELKVLVKKKVKPSETKPDERNPPTRPQAKTPSRQPPGQTKEPRPRYELTYEDYDQAKASSWADRWEGEDIEGMYGQMWIRWKECPLDMVYYRQTHVSGGSPKYEKLIFPI